MIVMKFGGVSVGDAAAIRRLIEIVRERLDRKPVLVVSAMGKTTRRLLTAAAHAAEGNAESASHLLQELRQYHHEIARQVVEDFDNCPACRQLGEFFDQIEKSLQNLQGIGSIPPEQVDEMAAYGELLSTVIIAATLDANGVPSTWCDARKTVITNQNFTRATPLFEITNRNFIELMTPIIESNRVPVFQGYIGSTEDGRTTTLGFEGSDYTAAVAAAALDAEEIQIWKDVDGLMTADPNLVTGALTVRRVSYTEAAELTHLGAKVLHPKAVQPAADRNIPIHIYNAKRRLPVGTIVSREALRCNNIVKSVAFKQGVVLLRIVPKTLADVAVVQRSLEALALRGGTIFLLSGFAAGFRLAIDNESDLNALTEDLNDLADVEIRRDLAIVTVVGEGLLATPVISAITFDTLRRSQLAFAAFGAPGNSLSLVVDEREVADLVSRLHERFFHNFDCDVFVPVEPVDKVSLR
jgi:aspartate kinase